MPLDSTLQPVDLGFKRKRLDVGATLLGSAGWSYALDVRHIVRDGTRRGAGSFFSNASQFAAPVDDVTDQIDASVSYASRRLQATLAYHASLYRSGPEALTWQNPFTPVVPGADAGQLALAPDNEFHQLSASVGYDITPAVRASGELAVGRMTQDAPFLAPTLNPNLVVALPAGSLHGKVNTLDATVRLTADVTPRLRVSAAAIHNERDNDTPIIEIPAVSTDMFLGATPVSNTPYSFKRDRVKVSGDLRGLGPIKLAAGAEYDVVDRARQETDETREATVWARAGAQVRENLSLTVKAAHAERDNSGYGVVASVQPPENPLLRKYNQADRRRDSGGVRADLGIGKSASVGVAIDAAADDYTDSPVGLTEARSAGVTVDGSVAVSEETRLHAFAQAERIRSDQTGSQQFAAADWRARTKDSIDVVGAGITHSALKGKLELGADLAFSRMRTDIRVDGSPFPTAKTSIDSLKLRAAWQLKERVSLLASWWYERYDAKDWRLDGVLPATVPNLLALGEQPPTFHVNVLRLALRYGF
jgi:MtrB/PioB family decaheme-associated outer membrane protein